MVLEYVGKDFFKIIKEKLEKFDYIEIKTSGNLEVTSVKKTDNKSGRKFL